MNRQKVRRFYKPLNGVIRKVINDPQHGYVSVRYRKFGGSMLKLYNKYDPLNIAEDRIFPHIHSCSGTIPETKPQIGSGKPKANKRAIATSISKMLRGGSISTLV